jgi:hypothetical protein
VCAWGKTPYTDNLHHCKQLKVNTFCFKLSSVNVSNALYPHQRQACYVDHFQTNTVCCALKYGLYATYLCTDAHGAKSFFFLFKNKNNYAKGDVKALYCLERNLHLCAVLSATFKTTEMLKRNGTVDIHIQQVSPFFHRTGNTVSSYFPRFRIEFHIHIFMFKSYSNIAL